MSKPNRHPHWLLRGADQAGVAALAFAGLAATVLWWMAQGGHRGRLIEIDRADPLTARFEVDVNAADWPELMQLPGVGPELARRIVESRTNVVPFADHEALRRVRGIGPKTLDRIRPYLRPMPGQESVAGQ